MHTYASEADLRAYMVDGDALASDVPLRARLEASSRSVDLYCNRSLFGSDFGPRVAANRYSGDRGDWSDGRLWLNDDFTAITDIKVALTVGGTVTTYVPETDFYVLPYDRLPSRAIVTIPTGSMFLGSALRGITVDGTAGYSNTRRALTATIRACLAADTTLTPSAMAEFSPGQTLWLDTEMVYVRTVGASTIVVDRAANGTTAAAHGTIVAGTPPTYSAVAAAIVTYPPAIVESCLTLAARRWRRRDVNIPQAFGDGNQSFMMDPSEKTILRGLVGYLRCVPTEHGLAEVAAIRA